MTIIQSRSLRRAEIWGIAGLILLAASMPALASPEVESEALFADAPGYGSLHDAINSALESGVAPGQLDLLVSRAHANGLSAEDLRLWIQRLGSLSGNNLPVSPVVSRYLQGLAKGIPASRIDMVVNQLNDNLEEAALRVDAICAPATDAVSREARFASIDHGAYALGLGVSPDQLNQSISLAWEESESLDAIPASVFTLGILVASGLTPEKSMEVVDTAWLHGYRGANLERLGKTLGRLGHDGTAPPAELINEVIAMITAETSKERVFQGLDRLVGREEYRLSGSYPGSDPTRERVDTPRTDGPREIPGRENEQPRPTDRNS